VERLGVERSETGAWDGGESWCDGASGYVLLWCRAYELTGERAFLARARRFTRSLDRVSAGAWPNVCCGLGGRAFALLAMDRVERDAGWDERALVVVAEAARRALEKGVGPHPSGLYKGFPGIVCAILDALAPRRRRRGFPFAEGYV
jgi:serine/threonine-protein kinase